MVVRHSEVRSSNPDLKYTVNWKGVCVFTVVAFLLLFTGACAFQREPAFLAEVEALEASVEAKPIAIRNAYWGLKDELSGLSLGSKTQKYRTFATFLLANDLYAQARIVLDVLLRIDTDSGKWPYLLARIESDYGNIETALKLLDESIRLTPSYVMSHLRKAELLAKSGSNKQARDAYQRCLSIDPQNAYVFLGIARIELQESNPKQALHYLEKAIQVNPELSSSYFLLSQIYEDMGDAMKAKQYHQRGSRIGRFRDPIDPWLEAVNRHCLDPYKLCVQADTYFKTNRFEESLDVYERAHALDPKDASICFSIARVFTKLNERNKALEMFDRAIELNPQEANYHIAKAAELALSERYQDALDGIDVGIKQTGGTAFLYRQRGLLLGALGDRSGERKMFLKAVRVEPDNVKCNLTLANDLWAEGSRESAVYYYNKVRLLSPLEAEARAILFTCELDNNQFDEAEEILVEIESVDSDFEGLMDMKSKLYLRWGNWFFKRSQWKQSEQKLVQALEYSANVEEVWNNLVMLLLKIGNGTKAKSLLEDQLRETPHRWYLYRLVSIVCIRLKKIDEAKTWLKTGYDKALESRAISEAKQLRQLLERLGFEVT